MKQQLIDGRMYELVEDLGCDGCVCTLSRSQSQGMCKKLRKFCEADEEANYGWMIKV